VEESGIVGIGVVAARSTMVVGEDLAALIAGTDGDDTATCAEANASRPRDGGEEAQGRVDVIEVRWICKMKSRL
jgi:hypothetical protein